MQFNFINLYFEAASPSTDSVAVSPQKAWFYDQNTGKVFENESGELGPIEAPSGPLPSGQPAGIRAHVYSYTLNPKESELFIGFLERPNPTDSHKVKLTLDMKDHRQWAQGRLIKRPDDEQWVSAESQEGYHIVRALVKPNELGQTPIYQVPQ